MDATYDREDYDEDEELRAGIEGAVEKFKYQGEDAQLGTKSVKEALALGLPDAIKGNPLGCGCNEAFLAGASSVVDSHIEADYMCDSGWHNFVVFELIGFENKSEGQIKVDSHGNLIEDTKTEARELGEF